MKHILKETIKIIAILAIAIPAFAFLAGSWSEPIQSPPGTNVDAPINVGLTAQTKEGGLWLNTGGAEVGLIVDKGNVGIGTAEPVEKLEVVGGAKILEGLQIGNTNNTIAGTIRWTGSDFEGYAGGEWKSLTVGGGACSSRQDLVDFGSASICLADGATASASCSDTQFSTYSYTLSVSTRARYTNGQVQTRVSGSFPWYYPNSCDSGWVNGLSASCSYSGYKTTLSVSAQTNSNGISGSGTGKGWRARVNDGVTFTECGAMTGAWQ